MRFVGYCEAMQPRVQSTSCSISQFTPYLARRNIEPVALSAAMNQARSLFDCSNFAVVNA